MDSNNILQKVIPFSIDEAEARKNFLDFIIQGDNTPIDAACSSVITTIEKRYYPVRCFFITYSADWNATSIWEHDEKYTDYQIKTVYIDYHGREHNSPGTDTEFKNGHSYQHQRRYTQKTIPVTKHKTVVDHIERTDGGIRNNSFQKIYLNEEGKTGQMAKWLEGFIKQENYPRETGKAESDSKIQPLYQTEEYAWQAILPQVKELALHDCEEEIPGSRYEDLCVTHFLCEYDVEMVLIPTYYVAYSYGDAQYECWLSGIKGTEFYYVSKPQDADVATWNKEISERVSEARRKRFKYGACAVLGALASMYIIPFCLTVSFGNNIPNLLAVLLTITCDIVIGLLFYKYFQLVKELENAKASFLSNSANKRKAIAEVVKNDVLTAEQQQEEIQRILNQ